MNSKYDLARARSEALNNILYSFLKQNIKSRNAKGRIEGKENGERTTVGLIRNKATLHVQQTSHFFDVVLHYYKVKLPETF